MSLILVWRYVQYIHMSISQRPFWLFDDEAQRMSRNAATHVRVSLQRQSVAQRVLVGGPCGMMQACGMSGPPGQAHLRGKATLLSSLPFASLPFCDDRLSSLSPSSSSS